jgi:hypothetical protein
MLPVSVSPLPYLSIPEPIFMELGMYIMTPEPISTANSSVVQQDYGYRIIRRLVSPLTYHM